MYLRNKFCSISWLRSLIYSIFHDFKWAALRTYRHFRKNILASLKWVSEFNCQKVFPYIGFKGTNKGKHVNAKMLENNHASK